ncbi:DsbA family protein [Nocardia asteroides]|uniref:DsbA family protein n=1 Tax=Nocardia asteroides TaxID=1824 RepID=UPI001E3FAFEA|nr:thioredoxin domain-containing protein [Nocardia asteroides]UGT64702.1 DsbA family protein [Nocardia asteroides]
MSKGSNNPLAAAERADRKRKLLIQVAVAVVLVGLVAAIGIGIAIKNAANNDDGPTPTIAATAPQNPAGITGTITDSGYIRIGKPDAKTTVRLVADLQCPACKAFEAQYGQVLEDAVSNGTAAVEYNIIAFLDRASSTEYSSRAANAAYCVAGTDPAKFQSWLKTMYAQQPAEGTAGLPDASLLQIARTVGYTDPAIEQCVTDRTYDKYVAARTDETLNGGVQSTPSVFVNGTQVTPDQLAGAITAAQ